MLQDIYATPRSPLTAGSDGDMAWPFPSAEQSVSLAEMRKFFQTEQLKGNKTQGKTWTIAEECCVMLGIRLLMCRAIGFRLLDKKGISVIPSREGVFGLLGAMYFSTMFPMRYKHSPDGMKTRTYTQHNGSNGGWKGGPGWLNKFKVGAVVKHCYCTAKMPCVCEGTVTLESIKQLMDDFGPPPVGGGVFHDAPLGWDVSALSVLADVLKTVHASSAFAERVRLIKETHDPPTRADPEGTISFGMCVFHVYSFRSSI